MKLFSAILFLVIAALVFCQDADAGLLRRLQEKRLCHLQQRVSVLKSRMECCPGATPTPVPAAAPKKVEPKKK